VRTFPPAGSSVWPCTNAPSRLLLKPFRPCAPACPFSYSASTKTMAASSSITCSSSIAFPKRSHSPFAPLPEERPGPCRAHLPWRAVPGKELVRRPSSHRLRPSRNRGRIPALTKHLRRPALVCQLLSARFETGLERTRLERTRGQKLANDMIRLLQEPPLLQGVLNANSLQLLLLSNCVNS
jgi:hypothetical protein